MPVHPLDGAFQRVDRAEKHLIELKRHVDGFRQQYLDAMTVHFNPNSPYHIQLQHPVELPGFSPIVSILLGEMRL